jgi:mannose-6-phosphate isomerase-like protein (cupin superfamily)
MADVVEIGDLPGREEVRLFEGRDHGSTVTSFIVTDYGQGGGPGLHRHPYDETFIVQAGAATFTAGDETIEARAGQVVVVPANTPHKFESGGGLTMVTIHSNDHLIQEELG